MTLVPAQDIIGGLKRQLGLDEKMFTVLKIWDRELGPLAKHLKIVGVKNGQLIVEAESNVHLQEATVRRREIIKKINQHFGGEKVVKGIKLKIKE
ncbi:MAG: DUF721 domain-containing protein [Elusimicrobiota bacterium]